MGRPGEEQNGGAGAEYHGPENARIKPGDAVEQGLVDAEVDQQEGDAGAGHDAAEPDAGAGHQPDAPVTGQRLAARHQPVLHRGQPDAEHEKSRKRQPAGGMSASTPGLAEQIGQGAQHETHEQEQGRRFVPRERGGQRAAADEHADARREEEQAKPPDVAPEIRERMRQGRRQGAIDAEQHQQRAAAQARQKAGQSDQKPMEQLADKAHGRIRRRRRRAGRG